MTFPLADPAELAGLTEFAPDDEAADAADAPGDGPGDGDAADGVLANEPDAGDAGNAAGTEEAPNAVAKKRAAPYTVRPASPVPTPPRPVREAAAAGAGPLSDNQRVRVEAHQGLVRSLALQIAKSLPVAVDLDDLIGYGQVGLMQATRRFNPDANVKFATFAYYRVRGAIYDGLGQMAWFRGAAARAARRDRAADDLLRQRAADDVGESAADLAGGLAETGRGLAAVFLLSQAGSAGGGAGGPDPAAPDAGPAEAAGAAEVRARVRAVVDELPPDAAAFVRAVYFEGLSLKDAGERVGISRGWASRLHAKVLARLGRELRRAGVCPAVAGRRSAAVSPSRPPPRLRRERRAAAVPDPLDAGFPHGSLPPHAAPGPPGGPAAAPRLAPRRPLIPPVPDPAPPPVDVAALLAPCPGDDPCGEDVKYDPLKDELRDLIKNETQTVKAEDEDGRDATIRGLRNLPAHPGWRTVLEGAEELLGRSKDLESLGWLAEALMELHGPAGLTAAYDVAAGFCENYWDGLRPRIDGPDPFDSLEVRGRRLSALTATATPNLPGRLEVRPLPTPPPTLPPDERPAFYHARHAELAACREAAARFAAAAGAAFRRSVEDRGDDPERAATRAKDLAPSAESITAVLDGRAKKLEEVFAERYAGLTLDVGDGAAPGQGADGEAAPSVAAVPAAPGGPAGPPRSRREAVARMEQAAEYFRAAEPHSPVGPLVDRAVRWAGLPFADVIAELIEDGDAFARLKTTLGIDPEKNKNDGD